MYEKMEEVHEKVLKNKMLRSEIRQYISSCVKTIPATKVGEIVCRCPSRCFESKKGERKSFFSWILGLIGF